MANLETGTVFLDWETLFLRPETKRGCSAAEMGVRAFLLTFAAIKTGKSDMEKELEALKSKLKGDLRTDTLTRIIYSTDASAYRERPLAVFVAAKDCEQDIRLLIDFCKRHNTFLIPRAAGTSLAGQVVGSGIVVDVSRNMNGILEINPAEHYVRVQPGVVLEELNKALKPYNLFFAPETSTANRCCLGGMVGNNSCGLHSLVYGSTRDHLLEAKVVLSDGKTVVLKQLSEEEFHNKTLQDDTEGKIYCHTADTYSKPEVRKLIDETFPDKEVKRRNNGYALDTLCEPMPNLAKLFCGSEGTLGFATELKLNLLPLPPKHKAVLCVHFAKLEDAFYGNLIALEHKPMAIELMDDNIIEAAYRNLAQRENTFFLRGKPKAVLIVEFAFEDEDDLSAALESTKAHFVSDGRAYDYSIVKGNDVSRVWALRKAGLGLLTNVPGSLKPVSVIEDTAVSPRKLPDYLRDFQAILDAHNLKCVYHAHIATGELHLRPILNLKKAEDVQLFREISHEIALLVKRYRGSLSGEHGDGRLRGEWIELMYSKEVYGMMQQMKQVWDEEGVFNMGKIVNTPPMDKNLRYEGAKEPNIRTYYSFEKEKGLLCAVEQCNGSAECRKSLEVGGLMCPTFKITREECASPRARANILRECLSFSSPQDPFRAEEILKVLDDCLMCKACKRECPSNVDITKLKSEVLQHLYDKKGYPIGVLAMNALPSIQRIGAIAPPIYNFAMSNVLLSRTIKAVMGFAPQRQLPRIKNVNFNRLMKTSEEPQIESKSEGRRIIYLYIDEFSRFQDADVALTAIKLFSALGYRVRRAPLCQSGRIAISKGMVKRAKRLAKKNIEKLRGVISPDAPLVGIEPSATLSFRDEYPSLVDEDLGWLTGSVLLFDEFFAREIAAGRIRKEQFTASKADILLHGHCQQKALIGTEFMERMLSLPENYSVETIASTCCGMAGSYGYEKRHYKMSEAIARSSLLPKIDAAPKETLICAPGTSCREQIRHFSSRTALHPLEIMYAALIERQ